MRQTITIDEPPAGYGIVRNADADADSVTLHWSATTRHPVQWFLVAMALLMLPGAIAMPVVMFSSADQFPTPLTMKIAFSVFAPCFIVLFLYLGLKRRGAETLRLSCATIEYDTGPTVLPWPLMFLFGPMMMYGQQTFDAIDHSATPFVRKRYRLSAGSIDGIALERVGERQRLRLDHGPDRIEIGFLLREPEREWLAEQLAGWQKEKGEHSVTNSNSQ